MFIAWTTVATRAAADLLARQLIERRLAACVQVEGPIESHYRWEGAMERTEEFRLMVKIPAEGVAEAEAFVLANHPYATPEWLVVRADRVGEKYLSWAKANSTNPPL